MKQLLLRAMFIASILVFAASCNDDDDDDNNPPSQPTASLSGTVSDPQTGDQSTWTASSISAKFDLTGLTIKAVNGNDTLSIAVSSPEVGVYPVDLFSPLSSTNYYVSVSETDTTYYTYLNATEGGGVVQITESDSANQTISGEFTLIYYNPEDDTDFFFINEGEFSNISYTVPTFETGGEGSISATVDGTAVDFSTVFAFDLLGTLSITGTASTGFPSINLGFPSDISAGTYDFGGFGGNSASYTANSSDSYVATAGTLEIISNSGTNVTGSFSFTGLNTADSDEIEVTNGSFNVDY